eukprot:3262227-Amphidinium_carterae.1
MCPEHDSAGVQAANHCDRRANPLLASTCQPTSLVGLSAIAKASHATCAEWWAHLRGGVLALSRAELALSMRSA